MILISTQKNTHLTGTVGMWSGVLVWATVYYGVGAYAAVRLGIYTHGAYTICLCSTAWRVSYCIRYGQLFARPLLRHNTFASSHGYLCSVDLNRGILLVVGAWIVYFSQWWARPAVWLELRLSSDGRLVSNLLISVALHVLLLDTKLWLSKHGQ